MNDTQQRGSHLFLVRMWEEKEGDNEEKEWHGRVQHIVSGEAHSFRDWPSLVDFLLTMLPETRGEHLEDSDR